MPPNAFGGNKMSNARFTKTQTTIRLGFALAALFVIAVISGIYSWASNPQSFMSALRQGSACTALGASLALYLRWLSLPIEVEFGYKFARADAWLMLIGVIAAIAGGFASDLLTAALFAAYVAVCNATAKRLAARCFRTHGNAALPAASAAILGSFVALTTIVVALLMLVWPPDLEAPRTFQLSLWTSALAGWLFVLGDNAHDDVELVIHGLPFGIPFNVILAIVVGVTLGNGVNGFLGRR
jgi:hypothetical protein